MSLPALDLSGRTPTSVEGLRLALDVDLGCFAIAPDVEREVRAAAAALADAGAVVEEVDVGWTRAIPDAWGEHWGVYLESIFGHVVPTSTATGWIRGCLRSWTPAAAMSAVDFKRLEFVRTDGWKKLAPILEQYDALLCPTMSQAARPVDEDDDAVVRRAPGRAVPRARPDVGVQLHEPVPGAVRAGRVHGRAAPGRPADRRAPLARRRGAADRRRAGARAAVGEPAAAAVAWPAGAKAAGSRGSRASPSRRAHSAPTGIAHPDGTGRTALALRAPECRRTLEVSRNS